MLLRQVWHAKPTARANLVYCYVEFVAQHRRTIEQHRNCRSKRRTIETLRAKVGM